MKNCNQDFLFKFINLIAYNVSESSRNQQALFSPKSSLWDSKFSDETGAQLTKLN